MSEYRILPAHRLAKPVQPWNYLFLANLKSAKKSCILGVIVGLIDYVLKTQSSLRVSSLFRDILRTACEERGSATGQIESADQTEACFNRVIVPRFYRALRRLNNRTDSIFFLLVHGIEVTLSREFTQLFNKLHNDEELTVEDFRTLFEGIATLWGLNLRFFANSSVTQFQPESEIGPIALYKGDGNQIGLLYDQETYDVVIYPCESDTTSVDCIEDHQFMRDASYMILRLFAKQRSTSERQGHLLERGEEFRQGPCSICNTPVRTEPIKLCPGHLVCDACRVHELSFGLLSCPLPDCTQTASSHEQETLLLMSAQQHGNCILPMGMFTCKQCRAEKRWFEKASCSCNLCSVCTEACSCHQRVQGAPENECSVCKYFPIDPFITPCSHLFCHQCAWQHFYRNNQCYVCNEICQLNEVKPYLVQRLSHSIKVKLLQVLARTLISPNPCFASLHETLLAYQQTKFVPHQSVSLVSQTATFAVKLSSKSCPHRGEKMLCNCANTHCISCLLDAKKVSERKGLPYLCCCGTALNAETLQKLEKVEGLVR